MDKKQNSINFNSNSYLIIKHNFILMEKGQTPNGLEISDIMIKNAIKINTFDYSPIVLNKDVEFKDYRSEDEINIYFNDKVIGHVIPNTVHYDGKYVLGDVLILAEYSDRCRYDNWNINYDKEQPNIFEYIHCELFY